MIHQFKNNGYNIVMDVNSGSVHVVDDLVYDVVGPAEQPIARGVRDLDAVTAEVEEKLAASWSHEQVRAGTFPRFAISTNCSGVSSFDSIARTFVTIPLYSSKFPIGYTSVILFNISWAYSVCLSSYSF